MGVNGVFGAISQLATLAHRPNFVFLSLQSRDDWFLQLIACQTGASTRQA